MTYEEAIRRIKEHIRIHAKKEPCTAVYITEALQMACEALEKQIPKKVVSQPYFYGQELHCPSCDFLIGWEYEIDKDYCRKCGQKLMWQSDTE